MQLLSFIFFFSLHLTQWLAIYKKGLLTKIGVMISSPAGKLSLHKAYCNDTIYSKYVNILFGFLGFLGFLGFTNIYFGAYIFYIFLRTV